MRQRVAPTAFFGCRRPRYKPHSGCVVPSPGKRHASDKRHPPLHRRHLPLHKRHPPIQTSSWAPHRHPGHPIVILDTSSSSWAPHRHPERSEGSPVGSRFLAPLV